MKCGRVWIGNVKNVAVSFHFFRGGRGGEEEEEYIQNRDEKSTRECLLIKVIEDCINKIEWKSMDVLFFPPPHSLFIQSFFLYPRTSSFLSKWSLLFNTYLIIIGKKKKKNYTNIFDSSPLAWLPTICLNKLSIASTCSKIDYQGTIINSALWFPSSSIITCNYRALFSWRRGREKKKEKY